MKKTVLLLTFSLISKLLMSQTAGTLDSTFSTDGKYTYDFGNNDNLNDVTMQPDQKIICTGVALSSGFTGVLKALRLNSDGTPDSAFGANGVFSFLTGLETYGYESYVRSDGKIIVAGIAFDSNYYSDWMLLRLNPNGTLDSTFGTNGLTLTDFNTRDDYAQALTVQADGKIVVSGTSQDTIDFYNLPTVARFTENGYLDSTFGGNGFIQIPALYIDNELTSIAVQGDGKIVTAGHYENTFTGSSDFDVFVMRLDTNGFPDLSFGTDGVVITPVNGGIDDAFGMELDTSGNIIVAGFTTMPFTLTLNMILLKYDTNGNLDAGFGNSGIVQYSDSLNNVANDLKIQSDNKIVVGGSYGSIFSGSQFIILWRYHSDGTIDSTFGTNGIVKTTVLSGIQDCNNLVLQSDGKIVAAGKADNGNNLDMAVLRYLKNSIPTGIDDLNSKSNQIRIFPNPVSAGQNLFVYISETKSSRLSFELVDLAGQSLFKVPAIATLNNDTISQIHIPSFVSPGIYFIHATDGMKTNWQKIVVQY